MEYKKIEEIGQRCARDLVVWNQLFEKAVTTYQRGPEDRLTGLESSMEVLAFGSFYLTTLTNLRMELHRLPIASNLDGRTLKSSLLQEISETVNNVRSALSAMGERNRSLREIYIREQDQAKEMRNVSGSISPPASVSV